MTSIPRMNARRAGGSLAAIGATTGALRGDLGERAGFETLHLEGYGDHYARTLTHWIERLDARAAEAERLAGSERLRVWRLYLRAARNGFLTGFTSIYQIRARRA